MKWMNWGPSDLAEASEDLIDEIMVMIKEESDKAAQE